MIGTAAFNRDLGLKVNRDIWNGRLFARIPEYFSEDFVMDYSPAFVRHGRHHVQEAVERAHATFEGFREDIKSIVADDEKVVAHFTIKGRHVGQWGMLPGTGKDVAFDEIVIMTVRRASGRRDRQRHRPPTDRRAALAADLTARVLGGWPGACSEHAKVPTSCTWSFTYVYTDTFAVRVGRCEGPAKCGEAPGHVRGGRNSFR